MNLREGPVLVTGATGFIGSHLTRRLVADGVDVHLICRSGSRWDRIEDVRKNVTAWVADLRDQADVERVCREVRPRVAFHLAGVTGVRILDHDLSRVRESIDSNVVGSINLLIGLSRDGAAQRLVRVGGLEEYGRGPVPYVETQREAPVSPYSASQVAVTHYYEMLQRTLALQIVTLRLALTYGPAQSEEFLIPSLIRHCRQGLPFKLTLGEQSRDFIFVADAVDALILAATTESVAGALLNIGSGCAVRIRDLARRVVELCGAKIELSFGAVIPRASEIADLVCDTRLARERLGWQATTSLERGLAMTIGHAGGAPASWPGE